MITSEVFLDYFFTKVIDCRDSDTACKKCEPHVKQRKTFEILILLYILLYNPAGLSGLE